MTEISINRQTELQKILLSEGASKVGFANLAAIETPDKNHISGVSIIVSLNSEIISKISNGPTLQYCDEYSRVNILLDKLTDTACKFLINLGFTAEAPKATLKLNELNNVKILIPHKTSARLSGLGWIGKNALITTEEFGSAIRLASVFTNAVFKYDKPLDKDKCGSCLKCKDVCPGKAILGINWSPDKELSSYYKRDLCRNAMNKFMKKGIPKAICGICIANCPYTQKFLCKKH